MEKCIGIINSGVKKSTFGSLADTRPDYMLPYAGRYRIIDFSLSTMTFHNISNVVVYGGKHIRSTLDHLGIGQPWELNRRRNGLVVFPPVYDSELVVPTDIASYFKTLPFFEYSNLKNIYLDDPMTIIKMELDEAYEMFVEQDLDVLFFYKRQKDTEGKYINARKLIIDSDGKLVNIGQNLGTQDEFDLYLGKLFIKKDVFMDLVKEAVEKSNALTIRQAIINNKEKLKIGTYGVDGHVEVIRDLTSYYEANMNLLNKDIYHELFYDKHLIFTKSKDEPSTLYKESSRVKNSLIANGCIIEGQVENSILFRGVKVGANSIIRNSIIIQKTEIGNDAVVVNVISDKYGRVENEVTVVGNAKQPYVIKKGLTIRKVEE